jgi:hypothetical protein
MTDTLSATELRLWAERCLTQANDPRSTGDERDRLMKMRASLLQLAENADWLDGKRKAMASAA